MTGVLRAIAVAVDAIQRARRPPRRSVRLGRARIVRDECVRKNLLGGHARTRIGVNGTVCRLGPREEDYPGECDRGRTRHYPGRPAHIASRLASTSAP